MHWRYRSLAQIHRWCKTDIAQFHRDFQSIVCALEVLLFCTNSLMWDHVFNTSLWPSDAIWRHWSGSTLAQLMACCLTAPSHYLNQCWCIISKVHWHSSEGNFAKDTSATYHWNQLENYFSQISFKSPRGQWFKWFFFIARPSVTSSKMLSSPVITYMNITSHMSTSAYSISGTPYSVSLCNNSSFQ